MGTPAECARSKTDEPSSPCVVSFQHGDLFDVGNPLWIALDIGHDREASLDRAIDDQSLRSTLHGPPLPGGQTDSFRAATP